MNTHETMNLPQSVSFIEALRFWLKLGFISFGGPAGQISVMHQGFTSRFEWALALIGLAAFVALYRFKVSITPVVGACGFLGLTVTFLRSL